MQQTVPLEIGPYKLASPVVLAPMAGITNRAFRRLCRRYDQDHRHPDLPTLSSDTPSSATCMYVSEMITSRALVERTPLTMTLIEQDPDEQPRSVQLYATDPVTAGKAAHILAAENRADHIDLNFGCPVPKVTRKGGGAALPWKTDLFASIITAVSAVARPYDIPVTVKMRTGIDTDHLTFRESIARAQDAGVAAISLHARTAAQSYSGQAHWEDIATAVQAAPGTPVLGNGDIWSAADAQRMMQETGCAGVVVGRGCLGRPWLFSDLAAAFAGRSDRVQPNLRHVAELLRTHAQYLVEFYHSETRGCRDIRKHIAWYLKGFSVGGKMRRELSLVDSLDSLDALINTLDLDQEWPGEIAEGPRGRAGRMRKVALPEGWLETRELTSEQQAWVAAAEAPHDGG